MTKQSSQALTCFKAYDIRGKLGAEFNEDIAYRIGHAYAQYFSAKRVVVGGEVRLTSATFKQALANGMIKVTASHNPMGRNGMKLLARGAAPISGDTEFKAIQALAETNAGGSLGGQPNSLPRVELLANPLSQQAGKWLVFPPGEAGVGELPFHAECDFARSLFEAGEFYEVFVDTPIEECENRDVKGLYAKARQGKIANFTGIDSPYEAPETPEVRLDTVAKKPEECVEQIHTILSGMS